MLFLENLSGHASGGKPQKDAAPLDDWGDRQIAFEAVPHMLCSLACVAAGEVAEIMYEVGHAKKFLLHEEDAGKATNRFRRKLSIAA